MSETEQVSPKASESLSHRAVMALRDGPKTGPALRAAVKFKGPNSKFRTGIQCGLRRGVIRFAGGIYALTELGEVEARHGSKLPRMFAAKQHSESPVTWMDAHGPDCARRRRDRMRAFQASTAATLAGEAYDLTGVSILAGGASREVTTGREYEPGNDDGWEGPIADEECPVVRDVESNVETEHAAE